MQTCAAHTLTGHQSFGLQSFCDHVINFGLFQAMHGTEHCADIIRMADQYVQFRTQPQRNCVTAATEHSCERRKNICRHKECMVIHQRVIHISALKYLHGLSTCERDRSTAKTTRRSTATPPGRRYVWTKAIGRLTQSERPWLSSTRLWSTIRSSRS